MGHYAAEMSNPEEEKREADEKKARRDLSAAKIRKAIEEQGIEYVLADIIEDPTMAAIRYR